MHEVDGGGGPLEWLHCALGCAYLSDLKQPELRPALAHVLQGAPEDTWSLRDWQDAKGYITGEISIEKSEQEVRNGLEHWLKED